MSNSTVGVQQAATPDKLIDNEELTVGGKTVQRQRVALVPARASTYLSGVAGSVTVPTGFLIVEVIASVATSLTSAGSITICGGSTITIPSGVIFRTNMFDAPMAGIGAGSVVATGTSSYFVRLVPAVA